MYTKMDSFFLISIKPKISILGSIYFVMNFGDIKLRGTMYIDNIDNPLKLYESYLETNTLL